jgi:hypothetical protein
VQSDQPDMLVRNDQRVEDADQGASVRGEVAVTAAHPAVLPRLGEILVPRRHLLLPDVRIAMWAPRGSIHSAPGLPSPKAPGRRVAGPSYSRTRARRGRMSGCCGGTKFSGRKMARQGEVAVW